MPPSWTDWRTFRKAKGLVLDLRRNGGGNTSHGYPILGAFLEGTVNGAAWKTREHVAAFQGLGHPRRAAHSLRADECVAARRAKMSFTAPVGDKLKLPVVVLTGPATASSAEDFLIFFEAYGRHKRVGQPTNGSTGQPLLLSLPNRI